MRTNTQEAVLSGYIASIGKRTPHEAAQDADELCRFATSLNRLAGGAPFHYFSVDGRIRLDDTAASLLNPCDWFRFSG